MINKKLVIILYMLVSLGAYCEDAISPTYPILLPQGPNMYTYPIYGEVPIDYYTGAMHISIPIHEVNIDGCKVPISLEYVGNGIKVSQDASNVGLGWYLNCGGNISLDCYGQDDFEYNGGYLNNGFPNGIPEDNELYLYRKNNNPSYDITQWDTRPDIYSYSFTGHNGKMIFTKNDRHIPKLLNPNAYLDVYYNHDARHWSIYDAFGNKYCFGNMYHESGNGLTSLYSPTTEGGSSLQDIDDPSTLNPDWTYRAVNAWPIDSIITNNQHQILFSYHYEYSRTPVLSREEIRLVPQRINPSIGFQICDICTSSMTESHHTSEIKQAVIDQISFPGGAIHFYYSGRHDIWEGRGDSGNEPSKLDSVVVIVGSKTIKRVHFHYHYMGQTTTPNTCRLILDSISGLSPRPYIFSYYTEYLPKKNSRQIDMWGYYNNSKGMREWGRGGEPIEEGTLVPSMQLGGKFYYGRNRIVDTTTITNAMLKSITYPTGGRTEFIYEPNRIIPTSTDAECIESIVSSQNISIINSVNYTTTPATITITAPSDTLTFNLDSTDVLDAHIVTSSIWGGPQQSTIIAYLVLRNNAGIEIDRKVLLLQQNTFETDWHFQLDNEYPAGIYTLTLEDAHNTAIDMPQPPYGNTGSIYVTAKITHCKRNRLGNNIEYAAGVRIASIKHYDNNDTLIRKQDYTYTLENGTSSGLLMVHPQYHKLFTEEFLENQDPHAGPNHYCYPAVGYIIVSDMLIPSAPMAYSTSLGYSRVIESVYPESQYGRTEYKYYNHLGNAIGEWPGFACVGNELNGELLQKNIYAADNRLVEKTCYLSKRASSFQINGLHYFYLFPPRFYRIGNQQIDNIMLEKYTFRHTQKTDEKIIKTTYIETGDSIVEINHSTLDSCLLLPRRTTDCLNQDSIDIDYTYAQNDISQIGQSLRNHHYPGAILQVLQSENGHIQDTTFFLYSTHNNHSVLSEEYHIKADNSHDTILSYKVLSFDTNNNPTTIKNRFLVPIAYLWGCSQTLPIVQVIGITNSQLQSTLSPGFISMLTSSCNLSYPMVKSVYTSISNAFPHAEVIVRSYTPGVGVSCEISPQGIITLYDYDSYGRLVSVSQEIDGEVKIIEQYEYHLSGE